MPKVSHSALRRNFRELLAAPLCVETASVFDPMSARIAADLGFEVGILGGSVASLQVLAAVGGEGLLEFDAHPNLGREAVVGDLLPIIDGRVPVPTGPGLGAIPDLTQLASHQTWTGRIQA